jgi:hypothetical protein
MNYQPIEPAALRQQPESLAFTSQIIAALRAALVARHLSDYCIVYCDDELDDIDTHLRAIDPAARWEPFDGDDELITRLTSGRRSHLQPSGALYLQSHEVMLGRWTWMSVNDAMPKRLTLCAAPSPSHFLRLRKLVRKLRRGSAASLWQVVAGERWRDAEPVPRGKPEDHSLILAPELRKRVEVDLIGFFGDSVAEMYRRLNVPYRRGVLLHGPPGNGKTSLIRFVGASLPNIPAMIVRPVGEFNGANLQTIINRWSQQAPAILVIEDLNWLLQSVDASMFLNALDGIESPRAGGLLLIATTNYPENLDPAINNRPGRFDVVVEVKSPDAAARKTFFLRRVEIADAALLKKLVEMTDRLSFAHLLELLRLAGLMAIDAGRSERSADDLLDAAESVIDSNETAIRGFPTKLDIPFGLQHLRQARQS